jgi:hypothetical protein
LTKTFNQVAANFAGSAYLGFNEKSENLNVFINCKDVNSKLKEPVAKDIVELAVS